MLNITYTISPQIGEEIKNIENIRKNILCTAVNPVLFRKLSWEQSLKRTGFLFQGLGIRISENKIYSSITRHPGKTSDHEKLMINYRRELFRIRENWLATSGKISFNDIEEIYHNLIYKTGKRPSWAFYQNRDFPTLIKWLDNLNVYPLISSAITYGAILSWNTSVTVNPPAALISYLYLFKDGFDERNLLVLEKFLVTNQRHIEAVISLVKKKGNYNEWIGFFVNSVSREMERIERKLSAIKTELSFSDKHFFLNDRQQDIILMLNKPGSSVTNRKVALTFNISQITASRELSRLTGLGLLMSHGRGRSVYYTRL